MKTIPTPPVRSRRGRRLTATFCAVAGLGLVVSGAAQAATPTPSAPTIVALATGQADLKPADRNSNASIKAAAKEARERAVPRAIINARVQAAGLGAATGLVPGAIISVEDQFSYFGPNFNYRFGQNDFCGPVTRRKVIRRADGTRKVVRLPTRRQCSVPEYVLVQVKVTFSAAQAPPTAVPAPAPAR